MSYKRLHAFYSGYVQGVGFRYTARSVACELGLVGWVKNLRDGKVEVVCEGEERKLKEFLGNIAGEFAGRYINDREILWEEATHEFNSFDVRF